MHRGVIVSSYGMLYRLSKRNARKLLLAIALNEEYNLHDLGTLTGSIDMDITDMRPEEAAARLED